MARHIRIKPGPLDLALGMTFRSLNLRQCHSEVYSLSVVRLRDCIAGNYGDSPKPF